MAKKSIKKLRENSFDGAPGGSAGTLHYGTSWGTPGGGNTTQNPDKFKSSSSSTQSAGHFADSGENTGSMMPDRPDRVSSSRAAISPASMQDKSGFENPSGKFSPAANSDLQAANKPLNPDNYFDPQVDQLFQGKKNTPSPDDIMSALQYELSNMVKKDKTIAKATVLKNMKGDPEYYSKLHMLNIDDKDMKVDEAFNDDASQKIYKDRQGGQDVYWMYSTDEQRNIYIRPERVNDYLRKGYRLIDLKDADKDGIKKTTFDKTKNLLDQMIEAKKQTLTPAPPNVNSILEDMWKKRHGFNKPKE